MNVCCFCDANAVIVAENEKKILKEPKLSHPHLSCACVFGHITNDMNGSGGRLCQMAYKGCSHISTDLGSHKAQTQWV